jgi:HPt (histidine-containing phosphotransfer) domain-containing protein
MDQMPQPVRYADRLDHDRLAELRELDEPGDPNSYLDRAIGNLLGMAERDVAAMQAAAATGDIDQLSAVAHRLAGSALNLGATSMGASARDVEECAMNGDLAEAAGKLPRLAELVAADLAALSAYREEQYPAAT